MLVGFISGILTSMGFGGGTVLILALKIVGLSQKQAQFINLLYYIPISIIATIINTKNELVNAKISTKLFGWGILGCIIGSYISIRVNNQILKKIFGILIFLIGVKELVNVIKQKKDSN